MKKGLIFLFIIHVTLLRAQPTRTILLENFIQASCFPSATHNKEMNNFLDTTSLSIVMINYHTPFPGDDIMYSQSSADVDERMEFYDISVSPVSIIDGNYFHGGPLGSNLGGEQGWSISKMQARAEEESVFYLNVEHRFSHDLNTISISVDVQSDESMTGEFQLNIAILEKRIYFDDPPGTNGETVFRYVLKDLINENTGIDLPQNISASYSNSATLNWEISELYEKEMISVVAFIQNIETKEILQAGISNVKAIYENDIQIISIIEPGLNYCTDVLNPTISPTIKIRNKGSVIVDSLHVFSQINREAIDTMQLSLELDFFQRKDIYLNDLSYTVSNSDTLNIWLELPNILDENKTNDSLSIIIDTILDAGSSVLYLYLQPDDYGSETSWEVINNAGDEVFSGGPYQDFSTDIIIDTLRFIKKGCYDFIIYDSYGNGINTNYGAGYFLIKNEQGDTIVYGDDFKSFNKSNMKLFKIPPIPVFDPVDKEEGRDPTATVYIRFNEKIQFSDNSAIVDPDSTFVLRKSNEDGEEVSVDFKIESNITVSFDDDLEYYTDYYLAFSDGMEDAYDNPIPPQSITFRTAAEIVGINPIKELEEFIIYPNPASEVVNIKKTDQNIKIESYVLINQLGKQIERSQALLLENDQINITHLHPGIYILQLYTKKNITSYKILKSK